MKNLQLVIFDMDGLIFDTERISVDAWVRAGEDFNHKFEMSFFDRIIGSNIYIAEGKFYEAYGDNFPFRNILARKQKYFKEIIENDGIGIKDGVFELLNFLEEKNINKIVASSSMRNSVESNLKRAGIFERFSTLVCGDDVKNSKPNPEIFLKALEKTNVKGEDAIVLEDSHNGLLASMSAGIKCIMIPDLVLPSEEDRKNAYCILESLNNVIDVLN